MQPYDDKRVLVWIGGIGFVVLAVIVQVFWPKKEFTFVLKANSGDTETFTTEDEAFAHKIKQALEYAFSLRGAAAS